MKENPDRVYVHPKFKHLLRMEAASVGKDIVDYTKDISEQSSKISKLTEEWQKKWQGKTKKVGFDFP